MPKIKPVMAWMGSWKNGKDNELLLWSIRKRRKWCAEVLPVRAVVVRVRISVVPKAKRKVKK